MCCVRLLRRAKHGAGLLLAMTRVLYYPRTVIARHEANSRNATLASRETGLLADVVRDIRPSWFFFGTLCSSGEFSFAIRSCHVRIL